MDTFQTLAAFLGSHADDVVRDLQQLIAIPSVSGTTAEVEIQHHLARRLAAEGLEVDHWELDLAALAAQPQYPGAEVERTEAWGVVGKLTGTGGGRSLLLDCHADVVPAGDPATWAPHTPFAGERDTAHVYGRGAADMKSGLVASLWAVKALRACATPLRGDLLLATVTGEEDGGLGTFGLLERGWRADACVIPEPTQLDIAPGVSGALTFRLTVRGAAAHASRRLEGVSAIEKFLPVFAAIRQLEASRNATAHPLARRWQLPVPIELGQVHAGEWASSVPDTLTADGRIGVAVGETMEHTKRALEEAMAALAATDPWFRDHPVEVTWWGGQFAASLTPPDHPLVAAMSAAHTRAAAQYRTAFPDDAARAPERDYSLKAVPDQWVTTYGSDLRLTHELAGIPTIHYGPGDVGLAHGPHERVPIVEVLVAAHALALLAADWCG